MLKTYLKSERGELGLLIVLVGAVVGLLASGTVHKLDEGKVKINKQVVKERQAVDYSKMND